MKHRNAKNGNLIAARTNKNDEFYTQYSDIEAEMNAYIEYNPNVFRDKTILLPCDAPEWSNFTKYFAQNFERLGLKKLISTSYAKEAGNIQLNLFEAIKGIDKDSPDTHGRIFVLECSQEKRDALDINNIKWNYLKGNGDFRSEEVTKLRNEADIIVTNPPFSLFREFFSWILGGGNKQFAVVGHKSAIAFRGLFPLLKENKIWLGYRKLGQEMYFKITEEHKQRLLKNKKECSAYKTLNGTDMMSVPACWYTNIDYGKRNGFLQLDTMENNLKYNKNLQHKLLEAFGAIEYPHCDIYDAIEVPMVECIPSDYDGLMGVPITFMDKYNPEQFEIIGIGRYTIKENPIEDRILIRRRHPSA